MKIFANCKTQNTKIMKKLISLLLFMPLIISAQPTNIGNTPEGQQIKYEKPNYEYVLKYIAELENKNMMHNSLKLSKVSVNLTDSVRYYRFTSPYDSTLQTRTYYKYNSDGYKTSEISYEWKLDKTKILKWVENYKNINFVYDTFGNNISVVQYSWVMGLYSISPLLFYYIIIHMYEQDRYVGTKINVTYDSVGRKSIMKYVTGDLYYSNDFYKYNSKGDSLVLLTYNYSLQDTYWSYLTKNEITYDSINNKTTDVQSYMSKKSNRWFCIYNYKYNYTYDASKKITSMVIDYQDTLSNKRIAFFKAEYQYSSNGSQLSHIYYNLDTASKQLVQVNKSDYAYDANGVLRLKTSYSWDKVKNAWSLKEKMLNYYSTYLVSERPSAINPSKLPEKSLNLYPNPAHDYVTLEVNDNSLKNVGLYNTFGQLLRTYNIHSGANMLDLTGLPNAIYIIKIKSESGINTKILYVE
jgi:hypothetical protein